MYYCAPNASASRDIKLEFSQKPHSIMRSGLQQCIAGYTVTNFWRFPIRHPVIFISALESFITSSCALESFITSIWYALKVFTVQNVYSLQQQIQFMVKLFGNKCCHCKEGPCCILSPFAQLLASLLRCKDTLSGESNYAIFIFAEAVALAAWWIRLIIQGGQVNKAYNSC